MKILFKEPLLYFILLSGIFFAIFQFSPQNNLPDNNKIVVSESNVKSLVTNFEKVWLRSPTKQETTYLINNYIHEEMLYREALVLGLDKNDRMIRKRLSQKMKFLSEDVSLIDKPSDEELIAFLDSNKNNYQTEARYSFKQILFDLNKGNSSANNKALTLLNKLKQEASPTKESRASLGDSHIIDYEFINQTESEIKRKLGSEFSNSLSSISGQGWQGPIYSAYGLHLIRLDNKTDASIPALNEIRRQVTRDWENLKQQQHNKEFYERLKKRFTIIIEPYSQSKLISIKTKKQTSTNLTLN